MYKLKQQKGVVTVVLVTLIGLSVMASTAMVATTLVSQREASVAAHAQTNSELMGWAGVVAFKEYLLAQGDLGLTNITDLVGQNISLLYEANKKEINVNNIQVLGCLAEGLPCAVSADILSTNMSARSATTIEAIYELTVSNGKLQIIKQSANFNFGGNTSFSGGTLIDSEVANADVTMNVDGDLSLNLGFKTKNLSTLTINATGDVYIDCGSQNCGSATINVTTRGKVTLVNGNKFGEIKALGTVTLRIGAKAKNIRSASSITLESGSESEDIASKANIILSGGSKANNITAEGNVTLSSSQAHNVTANGSVLMDTGAKAQQVTTLQYLYMMGNAYVANDVIARGDKRTSHNSTVYLSTGSTVNGNIFAKGDIRLVVPSLKVGKAYASEKVLNGIGTHALLGGAGPYAENSSAATDKANALVSVKVGVADIEEEVNDESNFDTRVDASVYKNEANYIFTRETGVSRVFLNKLKNQDTNTTYLYEHNAQFAVDEVGNKQSINNEGFALGNYRLNGRTYTGAVCLETNASGVCSSDIIGYLPRIAVDSIFGINDSNSYVSISNTWYIRSLSDRSPIDNASLAPGIMYFDGNLEIAGHANWQADSQSNSFTNSFLAEGNITAIAFSPRIYSPYNVTRGGNASLICNRLLKDVNGGGFNKSSTSPTTLSSYYLAPTNLCADNNQFSKKMDKKENGQPDYVTIDGEPIFKLDLGNVALMANGTIRVGSCAQIFGDVLARKRFEGSAACGVNAESNAVTGNISTQNKDSILKTTFGSGTKLVIAKEADDDDDDDDSKKGLVVSDTKLKWSRYK